MCVLYGVCCGGLYVDVGVCFGVAGFHVVCIHVDICGKDYYPFYGDEKTFLCHDKCQLFNREDGM